MFSASFSRASVADPSVSLRDRCGKFVREVGPSPDHLTTDWLCAGALTSV